MNIEIKHTELSEKVYRILKEMILNRQFVGGQKLDLNELSSQMKISRTPLKDAVNRLVAEGLMEVKPRSGTFVTVITTEDIEHVMEIRKMIELWCISKLGPDEAIMLSNKLSKILGSARTLIESAEFDYEAFLQKDVDFHKTIVMFIGNKRMINIYISLNSFLQVSRVYFFKNYERSINGQQEHERIQQHIANYDLQSAMDMLSSHIDNSRENMIEILIENGGTL